MILFIAVTYNFFYNFYTILIHTYEKRMEFYLGFCDKQSYGFLKKYNQKFDLTHTSKIINNNEYKNKIANHINQIVPPKKNKYIVITNPEKIIDKEKIIVQEKNCFILKND